MAEEIQISELELKEDLAGDLVFPVESSTDTNSTTLSALKDWLKTFFVGLTEDETITGQKTFEKSLKRTGVFSGDGNDIAIIEDVNGKGNSAITSYYTGNKTYARLRTYNKTSNVHGYIDVMVSDDGVKSYFIGQTWGNNWIKIPKGAGTAILICWGNISSAQMSTSKTITYPTAFSENPRISLTSNGGSAQVYQNVIKDGSSTSFTAIASGGSASQGFHWIAVGNAKI